jgi:glycerol-3-phosphate dehydrogenase
MPNIQIRKKIESISNELNQLAEHVGNYSGIQLKDARFVNNVATSIAETAAQIAALARAVQGNRSAEHLLRDTRRALGFTQP